MSKRGRKQDVLMKSLNLGLKDNPIRLAVEKYTSNKENNFNELVKNLLGAYFIDRHDEIVKKILKYKKQEQLDKVHKHAALMRAFEDQLVELKNGGTKNDEKI